MEITFNNLPALLFLLGVPIMIVVHIISFRYAHTRALLLANFEALKRATDPKHKDITRSTTISKNITLLTVRVIAYTILVLSIAGITVWLEGEAPDQDFAVLVDASGTMLARDLDPDRFTVAKQAAARFIDSVPHPSQVAVISYAGLAFLEQPLTENRFDARQRVLNLEMRPLSGTDIAGAIVLGVNELTGSEHARTIVLLTDGRHSAGSSIPEAISYAQERGVRIHTIGIGTEEGGAFLRTDLVTRLDREILEEIALASGGEFTMATRADELDEAFDRILAVSTRQVPYNLSNPLMLLAIILLFAEWGLFSKKFKSLP